MSSGVAFAHSKEPPRDDDRHAPITRPCACWTRLAPIGHDDVIAEASRATGPARFYRLPPGEKRDVLAQAVGRLYPTEGS